MAKRGQNEGSIYKRSDGRWSSYVTLSGTGGRRKYFYARTRVEVQEKLTEALRSSQLGLPMASDRITFGQFLDRWLEESAKPAVRPSTYSRYKRDINNHISPTLGRIRLAKLSPGDIQALMNRKLKEGLSPTSVRHTHAIIRRALQVAYKWQMVPRNVATLVSPPRVKRYEVIPLSQEQASAFMEAIKGNPLEALYTVAIALGLRRGEALALKWEDIDLEAGTLRVRYTLQHVTGGGWTLTEPKSRNSRRMLGLPRFAVQALKEHRKRQLKERMAKGSLWQEHGFVFASEVGTPIDGNNLYRRFKQLLGDNGLPDIRFHDLRHSCASLLLSQGVSPRVIMETLGHSQISLTMDTYSHVMPVLMRDAADKMDALLMGEV